jgi:uncharacterized CHY-type Zn-finger protein
MCKHILNVQAAIRAPCCKKWFDCADCHNEASDHELKKTNELVFACKLCKKVFRKDLLLFECNYQAIKRLISTVPTAITSTCSTQLQRRIVDLRIFYLDLFKKLDSSGQFISFL